MDSIYKFRCPICDKKHGVPVEYVGKVVKCGGCNEAIHVQQEPPPPPPKPTPPTQTGPTDTAISMFFDGNDASGQWKPGERKRKSKQQ